MRKETCKAIDAIKMLMQRVKIGYDEAVIIITEYNIKNFNYFIENRVITTISRLSIDMQHASFNQARRMQFNVSGACRLQTVILLINGVKCLLYIMK